MPEKVVSGRPACTVIPRARNASPPRIAFDSENGSAIGESRSPSARASRLTPNTSQVQSSTTPTIAKRRPSPVRSALQRRAPLELLSRLALEEIPDAHVVAAARRLFGEVDARGARHLAVHDLLLEPRDRLQARVGMRRPPV